MSLEIPRNVGTAGNHDQSRQSNASASRPHELPPEGSLNDDFDDNDLHHFKRLILLPLHPSANAGRKAEYPFSADGWRWGSTLLSSAKRPPFFIPPSGSAAKINKHHRTPSITNEKADQTAQPFYQKYQAFKWSEYIGAGGPDF